MNLKKFALKGLIILAVCVALCMFLSGTIKTISTPKVKFVTPKNGKLEETINLLGKIAYPNTENIKAELPDGYTLTVTKILTRAGYEIHAGDVLMETEITGYDAAVKECETNYATATEQLMALESKSGNIRIRRTDEEYAEAYYALRDATQAELRAEVSLGALLSKDGLTLPEEGYPEGADEKLIAAADTYRQAKAARENAETAFAQASRYSIDEATWTYMTQRQAYQDQMDAAREKLIVLAGLREKTAKVIAAHDGFVTEITASVGASYGNDALLLSVTQEGKQPVLRSDLTGVERTVTKGLNVNISSTRYGTISTKVINVGTTTDGMQYADMEITEEMLHGLGSVYTLSQQETPVRLVYKAKESTCLVPSSAVHGSGNDRYVFVVNKSYGSFDQVTMKVSKYAVTVLNEVDGTISLQDDISYYTLAYLEDRQIQDGDTVMEFLN